MSRAAVPKAPVHEDGERCGTEDEIGFSEDARVAPPAGDSVLAAQGDEPQFRRAVVERANVDITSLRFAFVKTSATGYTSTVSTVS